MKVIDHIGIAVRSLDERLGVYRALGLDVGGSEEVASQKVRVVFLPVAGTRIELLEPTGPDSPLATFIEKNGEGLHHLCFEVEDLKATMAEMKAKGFHPLADEPRPGAHGAQICFLHPKATGGVLIELYQSER
ncbi:MAG: methylmalonyl-CoA epimerase [Acidobacteria bacterium]|nr:methylmalonyl-CoA epimerase [Acidobacteriota bacterium]